MRIFKCDICGAEAKDWKQLTALDKSYRLRDVEDVCTTCLNVLNKHLHGPVNAEIAKLRAEMMKKRILELKDAVGKE